MLCAFRVLVAFWHGVVSGYKNVGSIFVTGSSKGTKSVQQQVGRLTRVCKYLLGQAGGVVLHETPGSMQQQNRFQRVTGAADSTQRRLFINQTSGVHNSSP